VALAQKGDRDGAIAEYRDVLQLNPNDPLTHYNLGMALERTRKRQEALQEYRAAYELAPQNSDYRNAYEQLLKKGTH
jgi:Flp pilus assembly protein TadD